jgi:hypothetical protein
MKPAPPSSPAGPTFGNPQPGRPGGPRRSDLHPPTQPPTELLILDDGRILAHYLSPALAEVLSSLNPNDEPMKLRAARLTPSRPARRAHPHGAPAA